MSVENFCLNPKLAFHRKNSSRRNSFRLTSLAKYFRKHQKNKIIPDKLDGLVSSLVKVLNKNELNAHFSSLLRQGLSFLISFSLLPPPFFGPKSMCFSFFLFFSFPLRVSFFIYSFFFSSPSVDCGIFADVKVEASAGLI